MDASGFERTVLLTPDMGWEVDVFGMPILDTVLRNQQVSSPPASPLQGTNYPTFPACWMCRLHTS